MINYKLPENILEDKVVILQQDGKKIYATTEKIKEIYHRILLVEKKENDKTKLGELMLCK